MAKRLIDTSTLQEIAASIKDKLGGTVAKIKVQDFASNIANISTSGSTVTQLTSVLSKSSTSVVFRCPSKPKAAYLVYRVIGTSGVAYAAGAVVDVGFILSSSGTYTRQYENHFNSNGSGVRYYSAVSLSYNSTDQKLTFSSTSTSTGFVTTTTYGRYECLVVY